MRGRRAGFLCPRGVAAAGSGQVRACAGTVPLCATECGPASLHACERGRAARALARPAAAPRVLIRAPRVCRGARLRCLPRRARAREWARRGAGPVSAVAAWRQEVVISVRRRKGAFLVSSASKLEIRLSLGARGHMGAQTRRLVDQARLALRLPESLSHAPIRA